SEAPRGSAKEHSVKINNTRWAGIQRIEHAGGGVVKDLRGTANLSRAMRRLAAALEQAHRFVEADRFFFACFEVFDTGHRLAPSRSLEFDCKCGPGFQGAFE